MIDLARSLSHGLLPLGCALATFAVPVTAQIVRTESATVLRFPTPTPTRSNTQVTDTYNELFRFPRFDRNLGELCSVEFQFTLVWNHSVQTTLNCGAAGGPSTVSVGGSVTTDLGWPLFQGLNLNLPFQSSGPTNASSVSIRGFAPTPNVQTLQIDPQDFIGFSGFGPGEVRIPFTIQHDLTVTGQCAGGAAPTSQAWFSTTGYAGVINVTYTYVPPGQAASVTNVGTRCTGPGGTPSLSAFGRPTIGSNQFTLEVSGPNGISVTFLWGGTLANFPLAPNCTLYVGPPYLATPGQPTSFFGVSETTVPIPNDNSLIGVEIFVQATVPSVGGPAFGFSTPTNALRLQLGC